MFRFNELLEATAGRLINPTDTLNIRGISIDSRTIKPGETFIAIKGDNFDGHDFILEAIKKGARCIIKEAANRKPSRNRIKQIQKVAFIEVQDTIKALGDIARFQRRKFFGVPVIAVTGSNGKTTTKEMVAHILSRKFKILKNEGTKNNRIGLPQVLFNLNHSYDMAILEVGTNHFGEVEYLTKICQPNIGIITNIGPSHLEYLCNLEGVLREKYKMIENLENPHIAILNADDNLLKRKVSAKPAKMVILGYGIKKHGDFYASDIKNIFEKTEFLVNKKYRFTLNTLGYYNIYNALAATAVACLFGIDYSEIADELATFDFPRGRLKLIKINNIQFIDDTYNSNPFSLSQALNVLLNFRTKGKKIFIMGDMLELGKYRDKFHYQAGKEAARACNIFFTVGRLSKLAASAARDSGFDIKSIFMCENSRQARDILFKKVLPKKNDVILVKGSRLMKMEEVFG
jgi:UDP-N-acetylmuramoyl-tripeptide--D-alanyl-D-alanine ligase